MKYLPNFLILLLALLLVPNLASAEDHTVLVGTESNALIFEPAILKISPGDNVTFVWTSGMVHNIEKDQKIYQELLTLNFNLIAISLLF